MNPILILVLLVVVLVLLRIISRAARGESIDLDIFGGDGGDSGGGSSCGGGGCGGD